MTVTEYIRKLRKSLLTALGFVFVLLLGVADYMTGPDISLAIFYLILISAVTWFAGIRVGVLLSVTSVVVWLGADLLHTEHFQYPCIPYLNMLVRQGILLIVVFLLHKIKLLNANLEEKVEEKTAELTREITEHKRTEARLLLFRNLINQSDDGIFIVDPATGRFTDLNNGACKLLRYSRDELLRLSVMDIQTALCDAAAWQAHVRQLQEIDLMLLEFAARPKEGALFPVEVNMRHIVVAGTPFIIAVVRDITERKQAEEQTKQLQEYLQLQFDRMPIGCITWDREFCTQTWNTAAEKIFGFTAAEVLGKHPYGLIVPKETQPDVDDIWRRLLEGDTTAHSVNENITKDGRTLICQWSNTPLRKTDGTIAGILSMVQDITESKRAEQSLRESEEKFRMITSAANDAIIMIGNEGEISFWNEAAEKIIGYSNQEALGKELHAFLAPQRYHEAHKKGFEHFRVSGEGVAIGKTLELQALRKDGKEFPVSLSVSAVKLKNKWNSIGIIRDVTEQRNIEAQLRHAQKMETVGTLAGGIAHDFNNILNVIIGYGTMVLDRLGGDQLSKGQLNEVLAAADRAANLTKRLLTFSRKQIVDTQPVNVNGIILGIEKMIAQLIGEDITFASELSNRKMIVMADTGQIEQVLINLASNARYAMPKGGKLTISTGIMEMDDEYVKAYGYGKAGMYARISVADTGSGMDAETQKRIFEPFFTTKGIGEGTGLGLSIVYGIIKQHDGYIKVYSEPGKGAEFKIYLPLIDEETAKSREVAAVSPPKGGTETILLAEDDRALRELSRTVLEAFGYTVITAENGEKAITSYKENMDKIHLLVLDMIMPEKNGKEAYAEIKNITPDIKALFISGYTMDIIHQKELLDEGMDFILKPVSPKDLVKKVREVLDR